MEQTVEQRMAGMAENIVQEDEAKRTQELVRQLSRLLPTSVDLINLCNR